MSAKVKLDAQELLQRKPQNLLGSEMIFEIATSLQDILDSIPVAAAVPNLDEERIAQLAAKQQTIDKVKGESDATARDDDDEDPESTTVEEQEALSLLMEQTKSREKKKTTLKPSAAEIEASGGLQFDNTISTQDLYGNSVGYFQLLFQSFEEIPAALSTALT